MVDKGIPLRLVLYSVAILYLAIDLFLIGGPLRKALVRKNQQSEEVIEAAKEEGVVARVFFQPILLSQVDRRVEEELWMQGRSLDGVDAEERLVLRRAALNDLIDLHLLRIKVRFQQEQAPVEESEVEAAVERFAQRFGSQEEFVASLRRRGWSEKELRYRLAARMQQERYLDTMIEITPSEEEARQWYEIHCEELAQPARLRARHIFLPTLDRDSEEVRRRLEGARQQLLAGEANFADLAREMSEDARSKNAGGDLGWMQADRLPDDFAESLFELQADTPSLIQTEIGWHLVEVLERRPPAERSFEEAREDVMAALEAVNRDRGVKLYRRNLRARHEFQVEIFLDVLERE